MTEEDWNDLLTSIKEDNCILLLGTDIPTVNNYSLQQFLQEKVKNQYPNFNTETSNPYQLAEIYLLHNRRKRRLEQEIVTFYNGHNFTNTHHKIASLPFKITIQSSFDRYLFMAMQRLNKDPKECYYKFQYLPKNLIEDDIQDTDQKINIDDISPSSPLIYYLFGNIHNEMVLTETDLLNFLVAIVKENPSIDMEISKLFFDYRKTLLFLGFGFFNWHFKLLLRSIDFKRDTSPLIVAVENVLNHNDQANILFYRQDSGFIIENNNVASFIDEVYERYKILFPNEEN